MVHTLLTFVPVAALLSITPAAATALVVRNVARGLPSPARRRFARACSRPEPC